MCAIPANAIIAYENGELSDEEIIALFQSLVDTGAVWHLQGHYGRTAAYLLHEGYINPPIESDEHDDAH